MNICKTALALAAAFGVLSSVTHAAEAPPTASDCDGGSLEGYDARTSSYTFTKAGASWALITNAQVSSGPSGSLFDRDTYAVTFSAQANNSQAGTSWLAQAQYAITGGSGWVDMDPVGPVTFHSGSVAQTHTMTWCERLFVPQCSVPGCDTSIVFQIIWYKVGGGNAIVDDFTLQVMQLD